MSDFQQAPDWWQASDGKWYAPQPTTPEPPAAPAYAPPASQYGQGPSQFAPPSPTGYPAAGYNPYGQAAGLPSVQGLSVASMVLGIIGILTSWCFIVGGVLGIIGLPLGLVAMSKIKKGQADPGPRGMALAGVVCSAIALALTVVVVIWALTRPGSHFYFNNNLN